MTSVAELELAHAFEKGVIHPFYDEPFAVSIDPAGLIARDDYTEYLDARMIQMPDKKMVMVTASRDEDIGGFNPIALIQSAPPEFVQTIEKQIAHAKATMLPFALSITIDGLEREEEIDVYTFQLSVGEHVYESVQNDGGESLSQKSTWVAWPVSWKNVASGQEFQHLVLPNDPGIYSTIKLQVSDKRRKL